MINEILLIAVAIQSFTLTDLDSVASILEHIIEIIARIIEIFLLFKKS